jgi:hypothetical protein
MAAPRQPDRLLAAGYASGIVRSKPAGRFSAIAVTVVIFGALQPTGHPSVLGTLQQFTPVAGAVVALIAFVGTTVQYLRDRKRDRALRAEEGIAESTNRLTAFPSNADTGIGSVVAALRSLRGFVAGSADPARIETEVTDILVTVAREDLNYQDPRHVRFDILCLQNWKGYRAYQADDRRENLFVLNRYIIALTTLDGRTGLVKSVNFDEGGMENIPLKATDSDIALLTRLTEGYGLRLALLPPDVARGAEQRFLKETSNNSLYEKMLSARAREVSLHASIG